MNINSFTETTNNLIKSVNVSLESLVKINKSLTTESDVVTIYVEGTDPITGDTSTYNYNIPSYNYALNKLNSISNAVDTFISGNGVVLLNDNTYREVKTLPIAKSPSKITNISAPSTFYSKNNWFFEDFLFPRLYIQFDLKGKIDDRSDRVVTRRLIFDNFDDIETQWFKDNFINKNYTYADTITLLNKNSKRFWIDEQTQILPLTTSKYTGNFTIIDKQTINNNDWFYLDTLNYGLTSDTSTIKNIEINVNDTLRYGDNNLFKVDEINISEKRIRITPTVGLSSPTINNKFYIYADPFINKLLEINVGYNECNILFIKGVNDDFNIIGDEWSNTISFFTNDLILNNSTTNFETYYYNFVSDFGKQFEEQAKEKVIPASLGVIPSAPNISASQFQVVQINKQINAALDNEDIKSTQSQIEITKTLINSLKNTIGQQKAELVELTDPSARQDLQRKIDNNVSDLSKKTVEYQSLVRSLSTLAYESNIVAVNPKYHIRGFFEIPDGQRNSNNTSERKQEIIQFEISYRYLRIDNTGNPLSTFVYNDSSTNQPVSGTFSDWIIIQSPIKSKQYDTSSGTYIWVEESISKGDTININQIDIPIIKGEKVEIKIRSISEAGWPVNPLKSAWSDSIIIDFPKNLEGSDQVVNILEDAQAEETTIKLNETLDSAGVITHLQDGVPNPNSANGTYFKHQSSFIAYDLSKKDIDGDVTEEITSDVQSILENLPNKTYVTLAKPAGATSSSSTKTITLQSFLQAVVDASAAIYDSL